MRGFRLECGQFKKGSLTQDEMWKCFNWLFSSSSKNDTSYKFIFFKAILDCIEIKDAYGRITFDTLFSEFTSISWKLVVKYGLAQKAEVVDGRKSVIERVLEPYMDSTQGLDELNEKEKKALFNKVKNQCKKYVVGALYGDTFQMLYSFSKTYEWIELNPVMERFIIDNKGLIENLNYYKWARFYEHVNSQSKTDELKNIITSQHARKNETVYRTILAIEFETPSEMSEVKNNTLELLIPNVKDELKETVDDSDIEGELFRDFSQMRNYLEDPILLIKRIKYSKGLI